MNRKFKFTDTLPEDFIDDLVCLDYETSGLNPRQDKIHGLAFAYKKGEAYYTTNAKLIADIVQRAKKHLYHNAVFDISFSQSHNIYVERPFHDTMLLWNIYDPDLSVHLKDLARKFLGPESVEYADKMSLWLKENNLERDSITKAPLEILTGYACEDAANTWDLFELAREKFKKLDAWVKKNYPDNKVPSQHYLEEQIPMVPVIVDMQMRGVKLDLERFATKKAELKGKIRETLEALEEKTNKLTEPVCEILWQRKIDFKKSKNKYGQIKVLPPRVVFNWDSNDHLKCLLYDYLKERPAKFTKKNNVSVDYDVLLPFAKKYPWIDDLLSYKELRKAVSMYFESKLTKKKKEPTDLLSIQEGGYVHPSFHLTGTSTGRLSSSNPNFQNLPKHGRIKELFVPRAGHVIVHSDYNQLELRLAAHFSGDPILLEAYNEGTDLHQLTADLLQIQRSEAKTINFAIIYMASGWRIAEIMGYMNGIPLCETGKRPCKCQYCKQRFNAAEKGDAIVRQLFGKYKGLKKYLDIQKQKMLRFGIAITNTGRIVRLPDLKSDVKGKYNHALKSGFNHPIQGFGGAVTKRAMIELRKRKYVMLNQTHDSLDNEVLAGDIVRAQAEIEDVMENVVKLRVPLKVESKVLTSLEEQIAT